MTRPAPYQCGHCPCTFKKIGALNAHVSKFHTEFVDAKGRRSVQHKYTKTLAKTKDPTPQTSGEFILLDGGQDENVDPDKVQKFVCMNSYNTYTFIRIYI